MAFGFMAVTDSGNFYPWQRRNMRREIAYAYPNGAAPLCGLLSLADAEDTDGPEFSWLESRYVETKTLTDGIGAGGAWQTTSAGVATADVALTDGGTFYLGVTAGTEVNFPVNSVIMIVDVKKTGAAVYRHIKARVTSNTTLANQLTIVIVETGITGFTLAGGVSDTDGKTVILLGSANYEGSNAGVGKTLTHPINPGNYTQIFRNSFAFSRTALQQGLEYDRTGPYKKTAREASIEHMVGIENALLWGEKYKGTATAATDSTPTTYRTMAGIHWYLKEWEKQYGGGTVYRPGAADISAENWYDDAGQDRRIISTGGTLTVARWNLLLERIFKKTTASSSEKLLLCGQGLLSTINAYYENKVVVNKDMQAEHKYGFDLRTVETQHGTLHMKSHPRFNDQSWLRYDGFVLDIANLKYRPLAGSDTKIRKNIHANDFDGRKDEFLTEASLEVRFPETHTYVRGLTLISG